MIGFIAKKPRLIEQGASKLYYLFIYLFAVLEFVELIIIV